MNYDYDDSEETVRSNEEWRRDPDRHAAWKARIDEVQKAYATAHEHLRIAAEAMKSLGSMSPNEGIAARGREAALRALVVFERDASVVMQEPNETYLGNLSAFEMPPGSAYRVDLTERTK